LHKKCLTKQNSAKEAITIKFLSGHDSTASVNVKIINNKQWEKSIKESRKQEQSVESMVTVRLVHGGNAGTLRCPHRGPGAEPLVGGSEGQSPPEVKTLFAFECSMEVANSPFF